MTGASISQLEDKQKRLHEARLELKELERLIGGAQQLLSTAENLYRQRRPNYMKEESLSPAMIELSQLITSLNTNYENTNEDIFCIEREIKRIRKEILFR